MKNVAAYIMAAEHEAGGALDGRIDPLDLVNAAGDYLVRMNHWSWLARPVLLLDLVSGQDYVDLPANVRQIEHIEATNNHLRTVHRTTRQQIIKLRGNVANFTLDWFVALEYPAQHSTMSVPPGQRLMIYPTPTEDSTAALRMNYLAGWPVMTGYDQIPDIPSSMTELLEELVRAKARADNRRESWPDAVTAIKDSDFYRDLVVEDNLQGGGEIGQSQGGIVDPPAARRRGGQSWLHDTISVT